MSDSRDLVPRPQGGVLSVFVKLKERVRVDRYGFPTILYNHSLIPADLFERDLRDQGAILSAAAVRVNLVEGYPTVSGTDPLWARLPWEPDHFFRAFHLFVTSHERRLGEIAEIFPDITPETVMELYEFFYWPDRARAYDILRPAVAARLRDQRVISVEDQHFQLAEGVLKRALEELARRDDQEGGAFAGVATKDLVQIIQTMTEIQRVAVRLPAKGPKSKAEPADNAGPDKQLEHSVGAYEGTGPQEDGESIQLKRAVHEKIASSEEDAKRLQQIAIDLLSRKPESDSEKE